jgi:prepilin-type N-terminal cleavage/methylation domain-containing protein
MDKQEHTHVGRRRATPRGNRSGLTLIEVAVSMLIVATVLLASARAFTATLRASNQARRTTDAAVFLETAMEDIGAQPFDAVLTLNGETLFDGADLGSSHYTIGLTIFLVEPDLLQVNAEVFDQTTERVVGRLSAQRSRR